MTDERKPTVQELAQELYEAFAPSCERIEIAGSIRRGKPDPKDIELVLIPRLKPVVVWDLFGSSRQGSVVNAFETTLIDLLSARVWEWDPELRRNGERYKRIRHRSERNTAGQRVAADLFIVTAETWGAQMVIRTGPADFSHALVSLALRKGFQQDDGRLWRVHRDNTRTVLATPDEASYFSALGLPYVEPQERSAQALRKVRR